MASTASGTVQLHRVTDESGTLTTTEVTTSPLTKECLTTDDVYGEFLFISVRAIRLTGKCVLLTVLVAGGCVYAWVGKGASAAERKNAMSTATAFAVKASLPPAAPVKIVKEGTEPPLFKQASLFLFSYGRLD